MPNTVFDIAYTSVLCRGRNFILLKIHPFAKFVCPGPLNIFLSVFVTPLGVVDTGNCSIGYQWSHHIRCRTGRTYITAHVARFPICGDPSFPAAIG